MKDSGTNAGGGCGCNRAFCENPDCPASAPVPANADGWPSVPRKAWDCSTIPRYEKHGCKYFDSGDAEINAAYFARFETRI